MLESSLKIVFSIPVILLMSIRTPILNKRGAPLWGPSFIFIREIFRAFIFIKKVMKKLLHSKCLQELRREVSFSKIFVLH